MAWLVFQTRGIRETAVTDTLREYPVRCEWIHECRGHRDTQGSTQSKICI
jgi:hypothetical protein